MSPRAGLPVRTHNLVSNPSFEQGRSYWTQFPTVVNIGGAAPDGVMAAEESGLFATRVGDEFLPVDPAFQYYLECAMRWSAGTTQPNHYFGLQLFDAGKIEIRPQHVNAQQNTETTLSAPCLATDTSFSVTSPTNWSNAANNVVAFDIQNDGSDLPNRNVTVGTIVSVVGNVVTMSAPIGFARPAGTKVRIHNLAGGSFFYTAAVHALTPNVFTVFSSTVLGEQAPYEAISFTKFWRGTRYAKILWLLNRDTASAPASTQIDNVKFYSLAPVAALDQAEFVHLIELDFASGPVHLCTGAHDLDWNAEIWEGIGGLLEIGGIEETTDARAQGIDLRLSGVDQTILSVLLNSQYRGREAKIYRAYLDPVSGVVIDTPLLLFQGLQLSPYTIDEDRGRDGNTVRISTRLSGYFGVERVRGIMSNLVSHQHYFAGDLFFQHAAALANVKIYWGTPVPRTPGSSSAGGFGGDDPHRRNGDTELR